MVFRVGGKGRVFTAVRRENDGDCVTFGEAFCGNL